MHSNVTSKNVSGFTLAGPPCTSWQGVWGAESRTQAQRLLSSLVSFQTITALLIAKNCLESVRPIATKLQKRDLDILSK